MRFNSSRLTSVFISSSSSLSCSDCLLRTAAAPPCRTELCACRGMLDNLELSVDRIPSLERIPTLDRIPPASALALAVENEMFPEPMTVLVNLPTWRTSWGLLETSWALLESSWGRTISFFSAFFLFVDREIFPSNFLTSVMFPIFLTCNFPSLRFLSF